MRTGRLARAACLLFLPFFVLNFAPFAHSEERPSIFLEDLTWTELRDEIGTGDFVRFMRGSARRHPAIYREVFRTLSAGEITTWLIEVNASLGGGLTTLSCKSEAWILVRAAMSFFATTMRVPELLPGSRERLAKPAAAANASTARTAPMMMYRRPRRGRPRPGAGRPGCRPP